MRFESLQPGLMIGGIAPAPPRAVVRVQRGSSEALEVVRMEPERAAKG